MISASAVLKGLPQSLELFSAQRRTPAVHKLVASYLGVGNQPFPLDVPLREGGLVRVFSRGETKVFWQIFIRGCYRLWEDCKTIIDAGANIGMFSVWAGHRLPEARIFAFEPHPETFSRLQHNLRVNQFGSRVQAAQFALAAQTGEREMQSEAESQRRSLIPSDLSGDEKAVKVPSLTLADLLDRYHLEEVDLIKMDIEGSEWEVLLSTPPSALRRIRRIQFEYHEVHARFGYSKERLFAHLSNAGFSVTHCQEDEHGTGIAIVEQGPLPRPEFASLATSACCLQEA